VSETQSAGNSEKTQEIAPASMPAFLNVLKIRFECPIRCSQGLVTLGGSAPAQALKLSEPFKIEEKKEYVLDLIVHPESMLH
jgi:hypothetical protein